MKTSGCQCDGKRGGEGTGFEQDTDDDGEAWNVIWYFDRSRADKIIIKISPILPFYIPCFPNPHSIRKVSLLLGN
jgi:hypothetical protein